MAAKQQGPIIISGTMGTLNGYYDPHYGWILRTARGGMRNKFKKSNTFQKTRENAKRFSNGSAIASALYNMLQGAIKASADGLCWKRFVSTVCKAAQADVEHPNGEKQLLPENIHLISGFELNSTYSFSGRCAIVSETVGNKLNIKLNIKASLLLADAFTISCWYGNYDQPSDEKNVTTFESPILLIDANEMNYEFEMELPEKTGYAVGAIVLQGYTQVQDKMMPNKVTAGMLFI